MNCCAICTLLFDVEPTTIGRSETDQDICILCAADIERRQEKDLTMYTIEPQRVTRMEAVIRLDETAIAATIADPEPLIADLRNLLKQWQQPAPRLSAPVKVGKTKVGTKTALKKNNGAQKPKLTCQYCGAIFLTAGRHRNHEAKCSYNVDLTPPDD